MIYIWEDAVNLIISIGDVLRVKNNAYTTDAGKLHNGRLVKVTNIKDGDVYVTTVDYKLPHLTSARHPMYKLEKKLAIT